MRRVPQLAVVDMNDKQLTNLFCRLNGELRWLQSRREAVIKELNLRVIQRALAKAKAQELRAS